MVLDLCLDHDRFGGGDDPNLNVHYIILMILIGHYMRLPLTKLENITLSIILTLLTLSPLSLSVVPSTSGRLHSEFVQLLFSQVHWETDRFFEVSRVHLPQSNRDQFRYRHSVFSSILKSKYDGILVKMTPTRKPLVYLTSFLSLGVPVPHTTQCIRDV